MNFYPEQPTKYHRIHKIMELTGWDPKLIYWQDRTWCDYKDQGEGINLFCTNISKSHVDDCFKRAYGYSSFLDPKGNKRGVVKSEKNYAHDGEIKQAPVSISDDQVFQKLIDTETYEGFVDWRAVIVMGEVAGWIKKTKPHRFQSTGATFEFYPKDEFPESHIIQIEHFCMIMGMDYGELDYLVDMSKEPGNVVKMNKPRYYIIDANKTPGGASKVEGLGEKFIQVHKPLFQ